MYIFYRTIRSLPVNKLGHLMIQITQEAQNALVFCGRHLVWFLAVRVSIGNTAPRFQLQVMVSSRSPRFEIRPASVRRTATDQAGKGLAKGA